MINALAVRYLRSFTLVVFSPALRSVISHAPWVTLAVVLHVASGYKFPATVPLNPLGTAAGSGTSLWLLLDSALIGQENGEK
jgi:hypothetical protein